MEARPPYIRFQIRPVEKRKPATEGGDVFYVDEIFALVTPHGSKDTIEKLVREWFPHLKEEVRQGRFDPRWLEAYEYAFKAFKEGQEPPLNGYSIKNWPAASPAEIKMLLNLGVRAVEDLAAANEELAQRIGMGARSLIQRAKDFLAASKEPTQLARQLDALRAEILGMKVQIDSLATRNKGLEAENHVLKNQMGAAVSAGVPPNLPDLETRLEQARSMVNTGPSEDDLIQSAITE
jgi:regulator of replication initiation timing